MGAAYVKLGDKLPNGKAKAFSEKGITNEAAATMFKEKVEAWNTKWLADRLPTL